MAGAKYAASCRLSEKQMMLPGFSPAVPEASLAARLDLAGFFSLSKGGTSRTSS
ncbi:MAG: hypothetical protein UCO86_14110 [Eggerthella lenta]|nr:hypothetical protein [Eggerthella lenta]